MTSESSGLASKMDPPSTATSTVPQLSFQWNLAKNNALDQESITEPSPAAKKQKTSSQKGKRRRPTAPKKKAPKKKAPKKKAPKKEASPKEPTQAKEGAKAKSDTVTTVKPSYGLRSRGAAPDVFDKHVPTEKVQDMWLSLQIPHEVQKKFGSLGKGHPLRLTNDNIVTPMKDGKRIKGIQGNVQYKGNWFWSQPINGVWPSFSDVEQAGREKEFKFKVYIPPSFINPHMHEAVASYFEFRLNTNSTQGFERKAEVERLIAEKGEKGFMFETYSSYPAEHIEGLRLRSAKKAAKMHTFKTQDGRIFKLKKPTTLRQIAGTAENGKDVKIKTTDGRKFTTLRQIAGTAKNGKDAKIKTTDGRKFKTLRQIAGTAKNGKDAKIKTTDGRKFTTLQQIAGMAENGKDVKIKTTDGRKFKLDRMDVQQIIQEEAAKKEKVKAMTKAQRIEKVKQILMRRKRKEDAKREQLPVQDQGPPGVPEAADGGQRGGDMHLSTLMDTT